MSVVAVNMRKNQKLKKKSKLKRILKKENDHVLRLNMKLS